MYHGIDICQMSIYSKENGQQFSIKIKKAPSDIRKLFIFIVFYVPWQPTGFTTLLGIGRLQETFPPLNFSLEYQIKHTGVHKITTSV